VREVRITLAQLPAGVREAIKRVRIFGPRDLAQQLADEIELRLEAMDLKLDLVSAYAPGDFPVQVPPGATVSPAFSLAMGYLAGRDSRLDFLPPHVTAWQQFASRYGSGKWQKAGLAAALVAIVGIGAFGYQQAQLWSLESQWASMKKTVNQLKDIRAKTHQFGPWFDFSIRGLTILRCLSQAFPEDGSVTAKSVEIRDLNTITCTGVARDMRSLLRAKSELGKLPGIRDITQGQTRGQPPTIQFSFNFNWSEGGSNGN
jgi:hypothetical protein